MYIKFLLVDGHLTHIGVTRSSVTKNLELATIYINAVYSKALYSVEEEQRPPNAGRVYVSA